MIITAVSSLINGGVDLLQIIAMVTMLLDHIGLIWDIPFLRVLGRLSMPIYAYLLVCGYHHTSSFKRYYLRLLLWAFVAQPWYLIALAKSNLCILATWLFCLVVLRASEGKGFLTCLSLISLLVLSCLIPMDYGLIAVLWVILFDNLFYKQNIFVVFMCIFGLIFSAVVTADYIQLVSFCSLFFVIACKYSDFERVKYSRGFKAFYHCFYPVHLFLLGCIRLFNPI